MRSLLILCALFGCQHEGPAKTAVDYVSVCTPGQSYSNCHDLIEHDRSQTKPVLPAGDLTSIAIQGVGLVDSRAPTLTPSDDAFRYTMYFREAYGTVRGRVLPILEAQLGPGTRIKGSPPIADPGCPDGDYWVAPDGIWILGMASVTWYSKPILGVGQRNDFPWSERYRPKAPVSADLWTKIGRLLVTY